MELPGQGQPVKHFTQCHVPVILEQLMPQVALGLVCALQPGIFRLYWYGNFRFELYPDHIQARDALGVQRVEVQVQPLRNM
ncbi:hypothetical protein D3C81_1246220 [compost metagenome]